MRFARPHVSIALLAAAVLTPLLVTVSASSAASAATTQITTNDTTLGSKINQFQYNGSWSVRGSTAKYGGDDHASTSKGSYYLYRCYCTGFALYGAKGPGYGKATVSPWRFAASTIDLYASAPQENVLLYSSAVLPLDYHVIKVTVAGERNPAATGHAVAIDRAVNARAESTTTSPAPVATSASPAPAPTASPSASPAPSTSPTPVASPSSSPTPTAAPPAPAGTGYLTIDSATLMALPTSGTAWTNLLNTASGSFSAVDLANQDNTNAGRTVAAALVYARTGQTSYRDKAVAQLRAVPQSSLGSARVLSVARQIAGYAIAADLVGYRDPAFVSFMSGIRTKYIGNHGRFLDITQTSNDTANNWGAWALVSRIAASRYVGDSADVARAARTFRGFLGDRSAHVFNTTVDFDPTWACGGTAGWVPINPAGCGARDGALVEDISRSSGSYPTVDDGGRTYSWEALGGATLSAQLLFRGGYPDVYEWSDKALLRAAQFLSRNGGYAPLYGVNQYIPWAVNRAYGVTLGPVNAAGAGRQYGFTDWLR